MAELTVVIPAKGEEKFVAQTIRDVLSKARCDIQVVATLDDCPYSDEILPSDPRVTYLRLPLSPHAQKRQGINQAISLTDSPFVMALDAHCMVAEGFDVQLLQDHQPKWVQIPRRHRLDAENWQIQVQSDGRPPIDYEYIQWRPLLSEHGIHGFKWDARTFARLDVEIDDTIEFQGSCWFMERAWFEHCGFMQEAGYRGWGQEAEEVGLTTWYNGGRVVTNKRTWYAHLHKGPTYGRMYHLSRDECRMSYAYSFNRWLVERKEFFITLCERFAPLPGWPIDWKDQLWKLTNS
jgi:hypothetical protein